MVAPGSASAGGEGDEVRTHRYAITTVKMIPWLGLGA
jgi:hypothetical protein